MIRLPTSILPCTSYPYTEGLVRQKNQQYRKAIEAYNKALDLAPDEVKIYISIATCYYNIGVDFQEKARTISNNRAFHAERAKAEDAFRSAVSWYEKANAKSPDNAMVSDKLYQLYKLLNMHDKKVSLQEQSR